MNANFQVPTCPFGDGMECCGNGVSVDRAIGGVVSMVTQSPPPLCRFVQIKVYVLVLKALEGLTVVHMVLSTSHHLHPMRVRLCPSLDSLGSIPPPTNQGGGSGGVNGGAIAAGILVPLILVVIVVAVVLVIIFIVVPKMKSKSWTAPS